MKTLMNFALCAAAAVLIGSMAQAQSPVLKADIPFAFRTGTGPLEAGHYVVSSNVTHSGVPLVTLQNTDSKRSVFALGTVIDRAAAGAPAMLFRCAADGCSLAGIRSSQGTMSYPAAHGKASGREEAVLAIPLHVINAD